MKQSAMDDAGCKGRCGGAMDGAGPERWRRALGMMQGAMHGAGCERWLGAVGITQGTMDDAGW